MRSKFKYGDRVVVSKEIGTGIVSSIRPRNGTYICLVKFDKPNLQPPEMEYPEDRLELADGFSSCCPLCGEKWKVSYFGSKKWRDCVSCNMTQEEAVKKWYDKGNKKQNSTEKINKAWEQLSNSYNQSLDVSCLEDEESEQELDDYDYDFGWYVPNNQD